jgi:glucose/arabinose dehydrogenase
VGRPWWTALGAVGVLSACAVLLLAGATAVAAPSATSPRLVTAVRGLAAPVFVTQAPGESNRLYVVEQAGTIRVVEKGRIRRAPFLDIRSRVVVGGEQGLLGLAFPKDYAKSRTFYVNYTAQGSGATVIDRYRARAGRALPTTRQQLLTVPQPYANHNGGHLAFGPDGKLWVGLGDGGAGGDPENRAQDRSSLLGKMFRLDVTKRSPSPELAAVGLRNPWRYAFDRRTGDLWIGDVGQNQVEEVDVWRQPFGDLVNFGWDVYEGRQRFEDKSLGPGRLIQPIAQYTHDSGCSVTGGYAYRGTAVAALRNRYVYGDYCSGTIWSIPLSGGEPRVEPVRVEGLVSFGEDLKGELYAVAHRGTIYRLR